MQHPSVHLHLQSSNDPACHRKCGAKWRVGIQMITVWPPQILNTVENWYLNSIESVLFSSIVINSDEAVYVVSIFLHSLSVRSSTTECWKNFSCSAVGHTTLGASTDDLIDSHLGRSKWIWRPKTSPTATALMEEGHGLWAFFLMQRD